MRKAIFPGSFDPITTGHVDIILKALPLFDEFIVAIGTNSQKKSLNNYGIMVGAEYKITENLTIGAQVNFSDRNPAYYPGSYYNQNDFNQGFHHGINQYHGFGGMRPYYGFGGW
mgnify:CR=1 FL=1